MISLNQIKKLFTQSEAIMVENKDYLIKIDGIVGDGDLGLTMSEFCENI